MIQLVDARLEHFDEVYELLQKLGGTGITKAQWRATFEKPFGSNENGVGFLLKDDHKVVGFFGGIHSIRMINGKLVKFCNTHSWIVDPKYGAKSLLLLNRFHKLRDLVLTNFSASPGPYQIMKKLGWKEKMDRTSIILVNPLRKFLTQVPNNFSFDLQVADVLNEQEKEVYESHKKFRADFNTVVNKDQHSFQVFREVSYKPSKINRVLPFGELSFTLGRLHYVSNPGFFFKHYKYNMRVICKKMNWVGMIIASDFVERFGLQEFRPYLKRRPMLYKATDFDAADLDMLYSEIFVLDLA